MANIVQTFPRVNSGGSGSGHTILNTDGTAVAQESKMQFKGLSVTDNSSDGKSEVAGIGLNQDSINDIAESLDSAPAIVIGDANNYSTTERLVGKWINGKPIYRKTISIDALPNNTFGSYPTNISNIEKENLSKETQSNNIAQDSPKTKSQKLLNILDPKTYHKS